MSNEVAFKKSRIVRVICKYKIGDSFGTGFFITKSGKLLTCFHVIFGLLLNQIRINSDYISIIESNEHAKLKKFFDNRIDSLSVEFPNGEIAEAELIDFNEKYDVASLKLKHEREIDYFDIENAELDYDDHLFFCGYQLATGYTPDKYPFAVNSGIVSAFPTLEIAGEKYRHIQINSINLGGNSGAPVFKHDSNKVIAMINGNMLWGNDNVAHIDDSGGNTKLVKASLRTPLSVAYATSVKNIQEETSLL